MPEITAPNSQAYGTYEAALAQMLQGGGQVAGPLNALALNGYARQQRGQYDLALQRTQALQQQEMQRAAEAELSKTAMQQMAPLAAQGAIQALDYDALGVPTNLLPMQNATNANLNGQEAVAFEKNTSGISNLAESGFGYSLPATSELALTGRIQEEDDQTIMPYRTPNAVSDALKAAASMRSADANMINAVRGPSSGGGSDGTEYETIEYEERDPATGNTTTRKRRVRIGESDAPPPRSNGSSNADAVVAAFRNTLRTQRQPPVR